MDLLQRDPRALRARSALTWLAVVLGGLTVARVAFLVVGGIDLSPDEAHYWEWSRRLDLSYYSKGPLVAYLIRALTTTFGDSALGIRLGAVLLSIAGSLAIYRLGCRAFGDPRAGLLAVVGLQITPLVWAGSLLLTIDPPFLVAWVVALLCLHRALRDGSALAWLGAGLAVGLGLLAKYTMLFVLPGLLLYAWRAPEARRELRRPAAWAAAGLALAALTPVVVWNLGHGWASARHVASQGRGGGLRWDEPLAFLGSQLLVLTPLVAAILGWALWVGIREGLVRGREPYRFLVAFAAPILGFYALVSLQGKVQANWAAAAYPPLAVVAAGALLERRGRLDAAGRRAQTRLLAAAAGCALVMIVLGHVIGLLDLPRRLDPTVRLRGWEELGSAVTAAWRTMPDPARTFVVSDRYQITSELAFYGPRDAPAYNVNLGRRLNQYDFWEGPDVRRGWDAIFVREGVGELDERAARAFERIEGPFVVEIGRRAREPRTYALYRGYGFRGFARPPGAPTY